MYFILMEYGGGSQRSPHRVGQVSAVTSVNTTETILPNYVKRKFAH